MTKIIDIFGEEARQKVHQRVDDFFNSENGFLIISDTPPEDKPRVIDLYANVCHNCVLKIVHNMVHDAGAHGLLAEPKGGEKHDH